MLTEPPLMSLTRLHRRTAVTTALKCLAILLGGIATAADETDLRTLNLGLLDAAKKGDTALVESRLHDGAATGTRDRFGNSALIYAARGAHVETARVLIGAGADANQANVNGNTPLFEAAGSGSIELVRLLLGHGVDPNLVSLKQVSPLANAIYQKHTAIAEFLLQHGARADFIDNTGKNSAVYAAANGDTEILGLILDSDNETSVPIDAQYGHELTLLMWAAGYGNADSVRLLVSRGASVDLTDDRGKTALMMAAENGHEDVVSFLVDSGADTENRDKDGRTARELSEMAGESEIAATLN